MFSDSDYGELLPKRLSCCNLIRIHTPQCFILGRTHYNCSIIIFVWLAEMWIRLFFQVLGISSNQIISVTSWKVQCHIVNLMKEGNCYFGMPAIYPQGVIFREREKNLFSFFHTGTFISWIIVSYFLSVKLFCLLWATLTIKANKKWIVLLH